MGELGFGFTFDFKICVLFGSSWVFGKLVDGIEFIIFIIIGKILLVCVFIFLGRRFRVFIKRLRGLLIFFSVIYFRIILYFFLMIYRVCLVLIMY